MIRVSTKWLNLLRKICAIFAQIFFANFCAIFAHETQRIFARFALFFAQFAQNRKFYAKCNFLGKLSKIYILSLELNN